MTEYKQLEGITLSKIYFQIDLECEDAKIEFDEFCRWTSYKADVKSFFEAIDFDKILLTFDDHPKWRDFLLKEGFIKEVRSKTYHRGQNFRYGGGPSYKLCRVDTNSMSLICMTDGDSWHSPPTSVKNTSEITEKEFSIIAHGEEHYFKLVED